MKQYCARCGQLTDQRADNLFVCPAGHDNWVNPATGATAFILRDDQVLFGIRGHEPHRGKLDIPGGFVDLNESLEQTAVREVKEELGIEVTLLDYLGSYPSNYGGGGKPTLNTVFVAEYHGDPIVPSDDLGGGEPIWRSIHDLPPQAEVGWEWYELAYVDLRQWWDARHS